MVEVKSTITPKLQADNKQTATKKKNPSSAFQCPEDQVQQYLWHQVVPPLLSGENSRGLAALGASGSSSPQWTPPALMVMLRVLQEMSLALHINSEEPKQEKKNMVDTKWCSIADIQVVGLPFGDSKKYRLGEMVSAAQVKVRTGNLNWCYCSFVTVRWNA